MRERNEGCKFNSTDVKEETAICVHSRLLFVERANTHARVKTKIVIIKAVQGTCIRTNWCEVLLLRKSQYLNRDTEERKKVSLKLNENYFNIPSVSTTEIISKLKRRMQ